MLKERRNGYWGPQDFREKLLCLIQNKLYSNNPAISMKQATYQIKIVIDLSHTHQSSYAHDARQQKCDDTRTRSEACSRRTCGRKHRQRTNHHMWQRERLCAPSGCIILLWLFTLLRQIPINAPVCCPWRREMGRLCFFCNCPRRIPR